jgi:hypothetical protein
MSITITAGKESGMTYRSLARTFSQVLGLNIEDKNKVDAVFKNETFVQFVLLKLQEKGVGPFNDLYVGLQSLCNSEDVRKICDGSQTMWNDFNAETDEDEQEPAPKRAKLHESNDEPK